MFTKETKKGNDVAVMILQEINIFLYNESTAKGNISKEKKNRKRRRARKGEREFQRRSI